MSSDTTTMPDVDDDPLGGVRLESQVAFGVRAAMLAGFIDAGDWGVTPYTNTCSSISFTPPEPDQT